MQEAEAASLYNRTLGHGLTTPAWVHCLVMECEPGLTTEDLEGKGKQRRRLMSPQIEWKCRGQI